MTVPENQLRQKEEARRQKQNEEKENIKIPW